MGSPLNRMPSCAEDHKLYLVSHLFCDVSYSYNRSLKIILFKRPKQIIRRLSEETALRTEENLKWITEITGDNCTSETGIGDYKMDCSENLKWKLKIWFIYEKSSKRDISGVSQRDGEKCGKR